MTRRGLLAALAAVAGGMAVAGGTLAATAKAPSLELSVILAVHADGGASIDPQLRDLPQLTRDEPFVRYNVYRLLERRQFPLDAAKPALLALANGRSLQVTLEGITEQNGEKRYQMTSQIAEPGKKAYLRSLQVTASANERLSSAARAFKAGLFSLNCSFDPNQSTSRVFAPVGGCRGKRAVLMLSRRADGPLTVQIPGPREDRPSWMKVGIIAAIGFAIGIAWPKLTGIRLGPSVPESASASRVAAGGQCRAPCCTRPVGRGSSRCASRLRRRSLGPSVNVGHGFVFACKTADGDSLKRGECGSLSGIDNLVLPRLRKLAECADAANVSGKLHLVVNADFARGTLGVELGRNQAISSPDALLVCAKADLSGVSLAGLTHDNPRYSLAYQVMFGAAGATPVASASTPTAHAVAESADGTAQVVWDVAIVRDAPKSGRVLARLQRGTTLHAGAVKDGWYPVKYGDGFTSDGWVYRGAIGR